MKCDIERELLRSGFGSGVFVSWLAWRIEGEGAAAAVERLKLAVWRVEVVARDHFQERQCMLKF